MTYLNTATTTIDVKLTNRGRELLGIGKFKITKFAFGDSEIDYSTQTGSTYTGPQDSMILEASYDPVDIKHKIYVSGSKPTGNPYLTVSIDKIEMSIGDERIVSVKTYWPPLQNEYDEEYRWTNLGPMNDNNIILIPSNNDCKIIATDITGTMSLKVEGLVTGVYKIIEVVIIDE